MKKNALGLLVALGLTVGSLSAAEQVNPVQQHNSNAVWFENWVGLSNASMTISTPSGEITQIFAKTGTPVFRLEGNEIADGIYRYELKAATEETVKIVNKVDNGRGDKARDTMSGSFAMNGHFTVSRGVIITPKDLKEE
ncbi:hypothetical protein [Planktotalea sp.]|uniref:hypothetical protein n=1 Tax=Planktotalea sp. TaxID=2029877 RepID=UPI00329998D4